MSILKVAPYHMGVLLQLGPLFSALSEFHRGISLYRDALCHYQETMPSGPVGGEDTDCIMLLVTLADFCNTVGEHEQAIRSIRDGARWIQGRGSQRYWSTATDDREYDVQGCVRPQGADDSTGRPQAFFPLDPNLRHRLALARLALGDVEEGQVSRVLCETIYLFAHLMCLDAWLDHTTERSERVFLPLLGIGRCLFRQGTIRGCAHRL